MELIDILRQINIVLTGATTIITLFLFIDSIKDLIRDGITSNKRSTGVLFTTIYAMLLMNSAGLFLILFSVLQDVDRSIINLASNVRILVVNISLIFISILIRLIRRGRL